ncbi:hypothetical protein Rsub_06460 [Raphidocelis subcapitata]|uniref:FAS1 domain-containing protein n=1 Tax=Raphidocelis subcapitata TaxID=307507 RepID=A0A2V0P6E0_9CHLO|nr:hypothetical protein Rsub_06460 [Raphidocelis subcapitata]|eukprot:GBF93420.1 hypothetical protein Rsub_06460 [Raphidocelis subcapitata]
MSPRRASAQALKAASASEALQAVPYFSTLIAALQATNMTEVVGPAFNGTLIAPQDPGFANLTRLLGLSSPSDLLAPERRELLASVLRYHVLPEAVVAPLLLRDRQQLPTLLGDPITVARDVPGLIHLVGGTPLNVVTLLGYQGVATGGVVVVTDQVLLPAGVISGNAPLTPVFTPALGLGRR